MVGGHDLCPAYRSSSSIALAEEAAEVRSGGRMTRPRYRGLAFTSLTSTGMFSWNRAPLGLMHGAVCRVGVGCGLADDVIGLPAPASQGAVASLALASADA